VGAALRQTVQKDVRTPQACVSCDREGTDKPIRFPTQGLSAMWVALSPLAGRDVWEAMCVAYAYQLQQAGDVHKAVRANLYRTHRTHRTLHSVHHSSLAHGSFFN
jgi:hypothetical protein